MPSYQPIITNQGAAADQAARLPNAAKMVFANFVIGDGGGQEVVAVATQAGLVNQLAEFAVTSVTLDPNNPTLLLVSGIAPPTVNGFTVREVGLLLADGTLYAVSAYPDTYLAVPAQGAVTGLTITFGFIETNGTAQINLSPNPQAFATQNWVTAQLGNLQFPTSEPHTFISDFTAAVTALIPPFPASETHTFISDFTPAVTALIPPSPQLYGDVATPAAGSGATTIVNGAVNAAKMAAGAAVGNIGFPPLNKGGDTMTGPLVLPGLNSTGTANFAQASVPTMPAGDSSLNAASTEFVQKTLAADFGGGKVFARAIQGENPASWPILTTVARAWGGVVTNNAATFATTLTFATPQPDTNYAVIVHGSFDDTSISAADGFIRSDLDAGGTADNIMSSLVKTTTGVTITLYANRSAMIITCLR